MTGAGLKKWRPGTRSGWPGAAAAIAPTDRALVFVARIVSGGADPVELGEEAPLHLEILDHGLDHDAGAGHPLGAAPRSAARAAGPSAASSSAPANPLPGKAAARRSSIADLAAASPQRIDVDQADRVAVLERQLGDPRAHRPGPDHRDLGGHPLSRP